MANVLNVIQPYWHVGTWVFDDASKGLEKEPLDGIRGELEEAERWLAGTSRIIDYLVKDANAREGFILLCSTQPLAEYQVELKLEGKDGGGYLLHYLGTLTLHQICSMLKQNQGVLNTIESGKQWNSGIG